MSTTLFSFNGNKTIIQCNSGDKMQEVCKKYLMKSGINSDQICFLYNGTIINPDLTFSQQANNIDKERNMIIILVVEVDTLNNKSNQDIINDEKILKCPKCVYVPEITDIFYNNNSAFLSYICRNCNLSEDNINIKEFFNKISVNKKSQYKCSFCFSYQNNNKFLMFCIKCKNIICNDNICQNKHNSLKECGYRNNFLISAYNLEMICSIHSEKLINYCITCEKSFCFECNEHNQHQNIPIKNIEIDD